jgi:hypothetical protein
MPSAGRGHDSTQVNKGRFEGGAVSALTFWITAAIIGMFVGIASAVVILISWFAIVITGKQSRGMWDFVLKVVRFTLQVQSYALLMTDVYPKFGDGAMDTSSSPPARPAPPSSFVPPPPPA